MDANDAFFTHTIVGAPLSVLLGRRQALPETGSPGLNIELATGNTHLSQVWQEWVLLTQACGPVGQPRMRPGLVRRTLERHALWIAFAGLASLLASFAFWGWQQWS